jgi:hypothetical protein
MNRRCAAVVGGKRCCRAARAPNRRGDRWVCDWHLDWSSETPAALLAAPMPDAQGSWRERGIEHADDARDDVDSSDVRPLPWEASDGDRLRRRGA